MGPESFYCSLHQFVLPRRLQTAHAIAVRGESQAPLSSA